MARSIALKSIDWRRLLPAYAAAWGIAMMPAHILPFLVGSLMSGLHLTEAEAGMFATAELGMIGMVALVLSPIMNRIRRRSLALAAIGLLLLSNGVSIVVGGGAALLICRIASGAGCGIMLAIGNATFASSRSPDKLYAQATFLNVIMLVALFNLLPWLIGPYAQRSVYGLTAGVSLVMAPAMLLLPAQPIEERQVDPTPASPQNQIAKIVAIAAVLIYHIRDTIVWAFAQQTGLRTGLTTDQIGVVFAVASVVALLGPAAAAAMGIRFGRTFPLTLGILATGTITYFVGQTSSPTVYIAMVLPWTGAHLFTLSYLMGMAGELDPKGRVISAAGGAMLIGLAIAPAFAGVLVERGGYAALGLTTMVGVAATLACALWLARYLAACPSSADNFDQALMVEYPPSSESKRQGPDTSLERHGN